MISASGWEELLPAAHAFESYEPEFRGNVLTALGERGCVTVVDRTYNLHKDKYGDEFTPYGTGATYFPPDDIYYEKARAAGGVETKRGILFNDGYGGFKAGLGVDTPNLAVLGRLLGVLDYEGSRPFAVTSVDTPAWKVEVGWTRGDLAEVADSHIDGNDKPQRDFWGFAEEGNEKEWEEFNDFACNQYCALLDAHFEAIGWH